MISDRRRQIYESLHDKEYRDAVVDTEIGEVIAAQIRAMREDRGWTQEQLGEYAGMAQETVSLLENPNYGNYTLRTLKRLASAFDVALVVRFTPFSQLVDWMADLSAEDLAVPSFEVESVHINGNSASPESPHATSNSFEEVHSIINVQSTPMIQINNNNITFLPTRSRLAAELSDPDSIAVSHAI